MKVIRIANIKSNHIINQCTDDEVEEVTVVFIDLDFSSKGEFNVFLFLLV
jgi:hypothetical protein